MARPAQSDFYAVLELTQAATDQEVWHAFQRLALVHLPDKNPGDPNPRAAFRKIRDAFEVLGDVQRRQIYDLTYTKSNPQRNAHQRAQEGPKEAKRDTRPTEETKDMRDGRKQHLILIERNKLAEKRKIEEELEAVKIRVKEAIKMEKEILDSMNRTQGWWDYLMWRPKIELSADEEQQQEWKRIHAIGLLLVRERHLREEKEKLRVVEDQLADLAKRRRAIEEQEASEERERVRIAREKSAAEVNARRCKWMAEMAKEAGRRWEQERREREQAAREWKEREEDAARERKKYMDAREEAEKARKGAEKEERAKQEKEWANRQRQSDAYYASLDASRGPLDMVRDDCDHEGWWPKFMGAATCEKCGIACTQWVLECPTCSMLACAPCQRVLRGRTPWPAAPPREKSYPQRERWYTQKEWDDDYHQYYDPDDEWR